MLGLMRFAIVCVLVCHVAHANHGRRRYKYYLDASRAEEVLASLALRPRLTDQDWAKLVGSSRQTASIHVKPGDTLWRLSERSFGDPFLWRKLWEVNNQIGNPHEIESGDILKYYRAPASGDANVIRVPVVKLSPGSNSDLEGERFANIDLKDRFVPRVILATEEDFKGEITGAFGFTEGLLPTDRIFAKFHENAKPELKQIYSIARKDRVFASKEVNGKEVLSQLVRIMGEATVIRMGETLTEVEIKHMFGPIRRGDFLIPQIKPVKGTGLKSAGVEVTARIIGMEDEARQHVGEGQLVLIDKSKYEGLEPGLLFRVFRARDPVTGQTDGVVPSFKGEVQVVFAGETSSVGFVLKSEVPLIVGDMLAAKDLFPEPPPPTITGFQVIELK